MHRPVEHLTVAMRMYPQTGKQVDTFQAARGIDLPDWPDWCFLPMAAWYAMVCSGNGVRQLTPHLAADVARLAAIGTWRYSQGIYRIDPELMTALCESEISGDVPADVLCRLPEWCVYVETPGMIWGGSALHGFWAHMEYDANSGRSELRFLLDCDGALIGLPLHIGPYSIEDAVYHMAQESGRQAAVFGVDLSETIDECNRQLPERVMPLISILMYLCSEEPEIGTDRTPGVYPLRPHAQKVKGGWRWFPASGARVWSVGQEIGRQIRNYSSTGGSAGRTVRPHIRRGHWHGFWRGPRESENRTFFYRWVAPQFIGG